MPHQEKTPFNRQEEQVFLWKKRAREERIGVRLRGIKGSNEEALIMHIIGSFGIIEIMNGEKVPRPPGWHNIWPVYLVRKGAYGQVDCRAIEFFTSKKASSAFIRQREYELANFEVVMAAHEDWLSPVDNRG